MKKNNVYTSTARVENQPLHLWLTHERYNNLSVTEISGSMESADTLKRDEVMIQRMIDACLNA